MLPTTAFSHFLEVFPRDFKISLYYYVYKKYLNKHKEKVFIQVSVYPNAQVLLSANVMLFPHICHMPDFPCHHLSAEGADSVTVNKLTSRSSCTRALSLSFSAWALDATERLSVTSVCSSNRRPM